MKRRKELDQEITDLRHRLSKLSEASLRINESLDFETVLQGVLDSTRSLTGSRYGVIVVFDSSGQIKDYLSSGMTADESRQLWEMDAIEGIRTNSGPPVRLRDFYSYVRSLGLPHFSLPMSVSPVVPFMATPVLHRDETVANIYLADKEGGREFTQEDEETMVMFASQAALVIANARMYRDEQRAKENLVGLANTAPVGVIVFETKTGVPMWVNQEARRITETLHEPGRKSEALLDDLTARWADGREVSLAEFPLAQALQSNEPVRAEEIVLQTADGRSITTLVNATPIRSEESEIESVIVTLQDMTPLEELDRLRAEFLGMVSHELRTPLSTIKGSVDTLLEAASELDPAEIVQFHRIIRDQTDNMRHLIGDLLDLAHIETGTLPVNPESSEVVALVDAAKSRFLNGGGRNTLHIDILPDLPLIMADRRRIVQVLNNLVSNAAKHSRQSSAIRIAAARKGVHVAVSVSDDGVGLTAEQILHLFRKFSRLESEVRGREIRDSGLGLAICKGIVEAHGGRIWAESDGPGRGSRFTFTIPAVGEDVTGPVRTFDRPQRSGRRRSRILCVDDDPQTLKYVREALFQAGYTPVITADPEDVFRLIEETEPHLILLDMVLPGNDGIELMKEIRMMADVPVIFLSVYGQDEVVARAFDMGAEDYIVKPFSTTELVARIRAALRRRASPELVHPSEPYLLGELTIDYAQRRTTIAGRPVELTNIEYRMLVELSVNADRVLTNFQLLQRVWGLDKTGGSGPVRNIIGRLRHKLGDDASNPTYIFNEPRVGYRMPKSE